MKNLFRLFRSLGIALFMISVINGKTIEFSGFTFEVREGFGAPANNFWREENVWVDELGRLHLKVRKVGNTWTCAELKTTEKFLYGKFSFEIIGRLDKLDKNLVFGIFQYPTEKNRDGFDEIDIEFTKWGEENNGYGNYTVYSRHQSFVEKNHNFNFNLFGTHTTQIFIRKPESVLFQSFHGHTQKNKIQEKLFSGDYLSPKPMPIYLNFWLFRSMPPKVEENLEIIVKSFKFEKIG